jgi:hypothetical protein
MSKEPKTRPDMRDEYDFAAMKGGIQGKYAARYRAGTNLVLLEPDVAQAFPTDEAVNEALRAALRMASLVKRPKKRPPSTMHPDASPAPARPKRRRSRGDSGQ